MTGSNNKRIAKNTIFLYARMLVTMAIGLYASRVILQSLGVDDFGIYNVVAGVVALFAFLVNTMSSASQRFFAYEIGKGDSGAIRKIFSITLSIYFCFSIIILVAGETLGLWFVQNKLNIPPDRYVATFWVFQLALASLIVAILRIPYNALIIANERMAFFAWSSLVEAGLKLMAVLMLQLIRYDRLISYSALMLFVTALTTIVYWGYCHALFVESRYRFYLDIDLLKRMSSFAGWNLFASVANLGANQGINILLNIFFNPAINAARAIAFQVSSQVMSLVGNFQTAASPQIIKYYAQGDLVNLKNLYYKSSRLSFYLLYIVALPVLIEMEYLLRLWLGDIPENTVLFSRLVIASTLIDCISGTTVPVVQATGNVKYYQIIVGTLVMLNVPISYYLLKFGFAPESTMIAAIAISAVTSMTRLIMVKALLGFDVSEYCKKVVIKSSLIVLLSSLLSLAVFLRLPVTIGSFITVVLISITSVALFVFLFGLESSEKRKITEYVQKRIVK